MMNKKEFVEVLAKKMDMTVKEASEITNVFLDTIVECTVDDGVKFVGFGSFEPVKRAARMCRNMQTGEDMEIGEKRVPKFKAGSLFKNAVKGE